jgi:hypothetical protein
MTEPAILVNIWANVIDISHLNADQQRKLYPIGEVLNNHGCFNLCGGEADYPEMK